MHPPLVSILIPAFNAGRWIEESLASALAQDHPLCEVIVVDDGSLDDTLERARAMASRHPERMRVISQSNGGASAARNRALRESRGEYIQFLDADDLISAHKISAQITLLQQRPVNTVASCAWGRFTHNPNAAAFTDMEVFRDFSPTDFLVLAAQTGAMMHPSAWLVPRAVADSAGPWNESLSLNDDGEYFCRVLLAGAGIAFCADSSALSFYRSGVPGSLSQQCNDRARHSQYCSIELITTHLLSAENSARTRQAAANYFQRFVQDFFPAPADLIAQAEAKVAQFGGATLDRPPMGPKTAALARLIGWRNARRLKHLFVSR